MNSDPQELELILSRLSPSRLRAGLLDRLEGAVDGELTELSASELRLEGQLAIRRPVALSMDFLARLENVVESTPFPVDEKVVLFTRGATAARPVRRFRPAMAAAAVAVLGGLTALMMPNGQSPSSSVVSSKGTESRLIPSSAVMPKGFVPASYGNRLEEASNEGIVWQNNRPHRVVKVVYEERANLTDANGKSVEVRRPRVEYILVPEKVD